MNEKLESLKKAILADGIIDADEVKKLQTVLYEDGIIDQEEADFLFELNDAVSGKDNHPSWKAFMVEAISKFLLEDEVSPNEVDDDEADWLIAKIMKDNTMDEVERAILENIKAKATKISSKL
ncbi:MAG: TerB family tellurite resistance protein [Bacteroidetes bacterium]|nr:TerB family tellurite resistance protein [Bacteroidota bacterium]